MAIRKIQSVIDGSIVATQGFRPDGEYTVEPYVYLGVHEDGATDPSVACLTIEEANTLGEYLRREAEFAGNNTGGMTE